MVDSYLTDMFSGLKHQWHKYHKHIHMQHKSCVTSFDSVKEITEWKPRNRWKSNIKNWIIVKYFVRILVAHDRVQ